MIVDGYEFKTEPKRHQFDCWLRSRDLPSFGLLMDMGTGKTKTLIDTIGWLRFKDKIDRVVIVAPKGVYRIYEDEQLAAHAPFEYAAATWVSDARRADERRLADMTKAAGKLQILIVNTEAFVTVRLCEFVESFMSECRGRVMYAVDESTSIRHESAKRTKRIIWLRKYAKYRRIMSGDPAANSPLDLYSQFRFLGDDMLGFTSFYSFRNHFAVVEKRDQATGRPLLRHQIDEVTGKPLVRTFDHVSGYRNEAELRDLVSKHAFVVKKEDCLDLPPKIYLTRDVELTKQQKQVYEEMRDRAVVEIESSLRGGAGETELSFEQLQAGEASYTPPRLSTADIVIKQLLRLHQIVCGFLRTDDGGTVDLESNRVDQLIDLCDEIGERKKIIVWANYRHNVERIVETMRKKYGPAAIAHYYGATSDDDRRRAVREFQDRSSGLTKLVCNQDTAGFGLTLTAAGDVIYFSNNYDAEKRSQSEDRAHRIGQTQSVSYVDLIARGTVEDKIVNVLRSKKQLSALITASNWRRLFE